MLKNAVRFTLCLVVSASALAQQPIGAKDSASKRPQATDTTKKKELQGQIRIGSPVANAVIYADGVELGHISSISNWTIPAGRPVAVSIRAKQCKVNWDSTFNVAAGAITAVGRRLPKDCSP